MKILVSAEALRRALKNLNLERETVTDVLFKGNRMTILANTHSVELHFTWVGVEGWQDRIPQNGRPWDRIKKLINLVENQPVVLEINDYITNITFQY